MYYILAFATPCRNLVELIWGFEWGKCAEEGTAVLSLQGCNSVKQKPARDENDSAYVITQTGKN